MSSRIAFAIGTGRCGTKFIVELLGRSPSVRAFHELNPINEIFYNYAKWYQVPIDSGGFIATKKSEIDEVLAQADLFFEASLYLSHSIPELDASFSPSLIFLMRNPEAVVASWVGRGRYERLTPRVDPALPPSFPTGFHFPYSYGRIEPIGADYPRWAALTQVGKCAWYWNAFNTRIQTQLDRIPRARQKTIRLEGFTFEVYEKLLEFLNVKEKISRAEFTELARRKPNRSEDEMPDPDSWTKQEREEFETEIAPFAKVAGYR